MKKKLVFLSILLVMICICSAAFAMQIFVTTQEGETITLEAEPGDPIDNVKAKIEDINNVPWDRQNLFYAGEELDDLHTLADYNIQEKSVLQVTYDAFVNAEWSDDYAVIGQPVTLHYELQGGSESFPDVMVQILYEHGSGMSYGGDHEETNAKSADVVIIPREGKTISVQVMGKDSEDRTFYLQVGTIPIRPNPDYQVQFEYSHSSIQAGETLTASYNIIGCESFTGQLSWVLFDEYGYHNGIQKRTISNLNGTIEYVPQYGEKIYLVIEGTTGDGNPIYYESMPVTINGSTAVEPISEIHIWSSGKATIGHPITLHYELSGGSGEFPQVTVQILYEHGTGMSYGGDHEETNAKSADVVINPREGKSLSVQIYGNDSEDRTFYLNLLNIPIQPNPDFPVNSVYNQYTIQKGKELNLYYNIQNCSDFAGLACWVIQDGNENNIGDWIYNLDSSTGTLTYTPQYGKYIYFKIKGSTKEGFPVYFESEPVLITDDPNEENPFGVADLVLPANTTVVEAGAFENDTAVTSVDARYCTTIGNNAFMGCSKLERIWLPLNCSIGTDAFYGTALTAIYGVSGGTTEAWAIDHGILFVAVGP